MLLSEPQPQVVNRHRFQPQAKLPPPELLRTLSPVDVKALKCLLAEPAEYIAHERLDAPDAEERLAGPLPAADAEPASLGADDSGVHGLSDDEPLTAPGDQEQELFLRLNYCRRRMCAVLDRYHGRRLNAEGVAEVLRWYRAAQRVRAHIVSENMALVLAMAKRTRIPTSDIAELISEGNLALLRSANKFDCSRGYRFSTYACRAILKSFSRVAARASRHRGRFPTEFDPALERSRHTEQRRVDVEERCVDELRAILRGQMGYLNDIERTVIQARFALDAPGNGHSAPRKGKTLEQVGELIGVTKERVRQIQNKALAKLRVALDETVLA